VGEDDEMTEDEEDEDDDYCMMQPYQYLHELILLQLVLDEHRS